MAISGGRDIAPVINKLLSFPYAIKVVTKDFHPPNHISFDATHPPHSKKAFESSVTIKNPVDPLETLDVPIWPIHCVQGTAGAEIIPEIDMSKVDVVMEKGRLRDNEMFSAFSDAFGNKSEAASIDLAALLKTHNINRVDIVGLAGDFCVKSTALDARKEGFEVVVFIDAIRSVNEGSKGWEVTKRELEGVGVKILNSEDKEAIRLIWGSLKE